MNAGGNQLIQSRRVARLLQFALGMAAFVIFFFSPVLYMPDSMYSMLTAESLLHNGTPDLSSYTIPRYDADLPFNTISGKHAYQLQRTNGRLLYGFPHGTSFLSIPFVAVFNILGISAATPNREFNMAGEVVLQKTLAAALTAIFVVISFRTALLLLDPKWSAIVAAASGLGTAAWSVASRGMWSHTWEITLGMAAVYIVLRSAVRGESTRPIILATILAWMYFVRPTGAVPAAVVAAYVLIYRRNELIPLVATGLVWLLLFIGYSMRVFGTVLPFYYWSHVWSPATIPMAVYGNLFSPSRGLFIYSPVFVLVSYWVLRYWRSLVSRPLAIVSIAIFSGTLLSAAAHQDWWGGLSFGPRYLLDTLPWLILLAIMGVAAIPPQRRTIRNPTIAAAAVALLVSIAINGEGAWSVKAQEWNYHGALPAMMFDWSRPQFLAPWMHL